MPQHTDTQAIIDTAIAAATPEPLDEANRFYAATVPAGATLEVIDLEEHFDRHRDRPRRKTGVTVVRDAAAFIGYYEKHETDDAEVWSDEAAQNLVAIFNPHTTTGAGWADHRATLTLTNSPAWQAWAGHDKAWLSQTAMAEHFEERLPDFIEPSGAVMLELAQSFKASTKVGFEATQRLATGETTLIYREETDPSAGKKGDITIPDTFALQLQPFDGGPAYRVTARFRYRIADGKLSLSYVRDRPEDTLRQAYNEIVDQVATGIAAVNEHAAIWAGTP